MLPKPISYTEPVSRCFTSVKRILFQPFDIGKWFMLGFSAWLATLLQGGGSFQFNSSVPSDNSGSGDFQNAYGSFTKWFNENVEMVVTIGSIIALISVAIFLALLWVRSRGKFMFLDNLVHNRALVKAPWRQFKSLGNSLFLWSLIYGIICLMVFLLVGGIIAYYVFITAEASNWNAGSILIIGLGVVFLLLISLIFGYISTMLEDFVIPIMYKNEITTTAAWSRFLSLHREKLGAFVLYFLWKIVLVIGSSTALAAIGFLTCCIGMFLMAIPYLGAVLILPVTIFYRLFGPEFLKQFGEEFDIFLPLSPPQIGPANPS